jgi:hypothetical protein
MMTVTKWEREGMPVARHGRRGKPSMYLEAEVRAWLHRREEAMKGPDGTLDLVTERARRERWNAALAEQRFNANEQKLLPAEEVETGWRAEVTAVRAKLLSWETTLADQVYRIATLEGLAGVERFLKRAVYDVLTELSSPPEEQAPRQKAKRRNGAPRQ